MIMNWSYYVWIATHNRSFYTNLHTHALTHTATHRLLQKSSAVVPKGEPVAILGGVEDLILSARGFIEKGLNNTDNPSRVKESQDYCWYIH